MKPSILHPTKKSSELVLTGVNALGFDVYENAYFKLSVEEMDSSYDRNNEHHGILTVWIDYYETGTRYPIIIEKSGFRYVPAVYFSYSKQPLYTSYQPKSDDHGIPKTVLSKVVKLVRAIKKRQAEDTTNYLVKKWTTLLQEHQLQPIQADTDKHSLYLTYRTTQQEEIRTCLYQSNSRFPCLLVEAVNQLNQIAGEIKKSQHHADSH